MFTLRRSLVFFLVCGCWALIWLTASAPVYRVNSSLLELEQAAKQGYNHAMLSLAQRYSAQQRRSEALLWGQRALDAGSKESLAQLLYWYPQNERQWYSKAAAQGDINAQVFMWSLQVVGYKEIHINPRQVRLLNEQSRALLAQLTLQHNSPINLPHWRALAPPTTYWQQLIVGDEVLRRKPSQCDFNLSFHTERGQGLAATLQWLGALDPFLQGRGYRLCATHQQLTVENACEVKRGRAFCTAEQTQTQAVSVMVAKKGSANTRNGVVFINEQAGWRVLLHELGHALGLADEYPMQRELAEQFCTGNYKFSAHNIVLIEPRAFSEHDVQQLTASLPWHAHLTTKIAQPIPVGAAIYYRLGSTTPREVGLYTTGTCEATRLQAWKPVSQVTFMEQHEITNVPDLYLQWMAAAMAGIKNGS